LARAKNGCGREIWVALGTYGPGAQPGDTFVIPDGLAVYGGFVGSETSRDERRPGVWPTVLSGEIGDPGETGDNVRWVVEADVAGTAQTTILDGFIIARGKEAGLALQGCGPKLHIGNCVIEDNAGHGLRCTGSEPNVVACVIRDNGGDGVNAWGSAAGPRLQRCKVYANGGRGVYTQGCAPVVLESFLHHNAAVGIEPNEAPTNPASVLRNNTITCNWGGGVARSGGAAPALSNCIVWHNNQAAGFARQLTGCSATYSCITDPADPEVGNPNPDPVTHNITRNPSFAYGDPNLHNDFHLAPNSPCLDKGQDNHGLHERDLDGDARHTGGGVDIGADEICCADVSHPWDWNADGLVNLPDLTVLGRAWLTIQPGYAGDPNNCIGWDARCDFNGDHCVDLRDLNLLCEDWLWRACWRPEEAGGGMLGMGLGGAGESTPAALSAEASLSASDTPTTALARTAPAIAQEIDQLEEGIAWLVETWLADPDLQAAIPEADLKDFLNRLYDSLAELRQEYQAATPTSPAE